MTRQIAAFLLGETLFGVNILLVKEIYRHMIISPIPDAPPQLRGLMNLRGRVVTVIDLAVCLGREPTAEMENTRLLIFKTQEEILSFVNRSLLPDIALGEDIVGFIIDGMDDVFMMDDDALLPPPPNLKEIHEDLIQGVVKRAGRLVILLDVPAVLQQALRATHEAAGEKKEALAI